MNTQTKHSSHFYGGSSNVESLRDPHHTHCLSIAGHYRCGKASPFTVQPRSHTSGLRLVRKDQKNPERNST
ncbi:hypothetical protein TNCT_686631 [Trichonephila clavata]|uniref:Uncharacterized protein n=1 Tax=Trichonephila clavata TaxID=2740835 RepID=A0A8X6F2E8_TRICU|nr:hypothetical protein TNCT_686631 [Trichonephila clavata]